MAVVLHEIIDSDFEYFLKATTTGTNSAASIFDASAAEGAATDPRVSITGIAWSVAAQTDILWDATSNVVALSLSGSGKVGFADGVPSIPNNAGSGVTGDVLVTNGTSVGTIIIKFSKVSGWDDIT
jgi:hypothetical protein